MHRTWFSSASMVVTLCRASVLASAIFAWILATLFRCFRYLSLGFSSLRAPFLRESLRCSRASLRSYFLRWRGFPILRPSESVASVSTPRSHLAVKNKDIFLCGISMGCATTLMAAGLDLPDNVKGIIADCGFTSPWLETTTGR